MGSFIHVYTDGGGIRECKVPDDFSGMGSVPFVLKFPGFKKCLLASLVASSTASRTSNIVTITATAHGITTGSTYVGFRFFYPGSPSLAAGWYDSIVSVPDANTITFNAPGTNFSSESVNAGAAYTTATQVSGAGIIPAGYLLDVTKSVSMAIPMGGGGTAATKTLKMTFNGVALLSSTATTACFGCRRSEIYSVSNTQIGAFFSVQNGSSSSAPSVTIDKTTDISVGVQLTISAAADFIVLYEGPSLYLE
jgi:hypothetical protein